MSITDTFILIFPFSLPLIEMNDGRVDSVIANYNDNVLCARVCQEPTHPQVYKGIKNNIFRLQ